MARLISAKGLTAGATIGSPMQGTKWIVKWALVVLNIGGTAATSSSYLTIFRANVVQTTLLAGGSGGAANTSYFWLGDVTAQTPGPPGGFTTWRQFPEIFSVDVIQLVVNFGSAATVDYYILVEEASS